MIILGAKLSGKYSIILLILLDINLSKGDTSPAEYLCYFKWSIPFCVKKVPVNIDY